MKNYCVGCISFNWNFIFSDERGVLLASRPRLQWAKLDNGIAATGASWGNYVCHFNNS